MFNIKDSRKIGRPKLADTPLKKKSMIAVVICFVMAAVLSVMGAYFLDLIPGITRLRGNVYKKYDIGEKFCLGTECFYVIEDDGDEVAALAEYNLMVGYYYDTETELTTEITPENSEGYGLQNENAVGGARAIDGKYVGVTNFANTNYWSGMGSDQYVYGKKSKVYDYVQAYEQTLVDSGYPSVKASIVDKSKLSYLDSKGFSDLYHNTYFWTGNCAAGGYMYRVDSNTVGTTYALDIRVYGVRPMIRIAKEDFAEVVEVDDDGYYIGKEICLDEECFNVISYNDDTVTALAKYSIDYSAAAQDNSSDAQLEFSVSSYWSDSGLIEDYGDSYPANVYSDSSYLKFVFNIYERKLIKNGYTSVKIRGLDYGELSDLGCSLDTNSCSNSQYASWLLTRGEYWLETAKDNTKVYTIDSSGNINARKYDTSHYLRPVITIDRSNITEKREMTDSQERYFVGSEVCYKDECFNYLSTDGETVRLIAKYNLLIGKNFVVRSGETVEEDVPIDDKEYCRQSSKATGNISSSENLYAVVPFSTSAYWWNNSTGTYDSKYNRTESVLLNSQTYGYVYDPENVTFGEQIQSYKDYLKTQTGKESIDIELPSSMDIYNVYLSEKVAFEIPSWYNNTGFWTGVLDSQNELAVVDGSEGIFDTVRYDDYTGVRVILTMSKDDYDGIVKQPEEEPVEEDTTTTTIEETTTAEEEEEEVVEEVVKTITNKLPDAVKQVTNYVNGKKSGVTYTNKAVTSKYVKDVDTNIFAKKLNKVTVTEGDDTMLFIIACVILSILLATLMVVLFGKDKDKEKELPVK